jgi:dCMP deaminase
MMNRPSWDETWMEFAIVMSRRSLCPSGVGAVIVDQRQRVISTGYTGPPATYKAWKVNGAEAVAWNCTRDCPRQKLDPAQRRRRIYGLECPTVHAEQNALNFADRSRMEGGAFYTSSVPCEACCKAIANSGVRSVTWRATSADAWRGSQEQRSFLEHDCNLKVAVIKAPGAYIRG